MAMTRGSVDAPARGIAQVAGKRDPRSGLASEVVRPLRECRREVHRKCRLTRYKS
jgi:hypothetical protein